MNKKEKFFMYFLFAISLYLLWSVDWKIAVGTLLFVWANNIYKYLK